MDVSQISFAFIALVSGIGLTWVWAQRRHQRVCQALTQDHSAEGQLTRDMQTGLFQTLFDAAPECIKVQDSHGRIQRINTAGLGLLETAHPARIIGKTVYSVMAPEYHAAYRELTRKVFSGGSGVMEFELITFLGRRRWLETHAVPLRDGEQIVSLLAITRDIDERKRMHQQLEEQREQLQTIIESEPECVKLQDPQGVIKEMNPAGIALLQAEHPEQVIGRSVYDFLIEDYLEPYKELTRQVFAGERRSMEFEVNTLGGNRRWLETHAAPLTDAQGNIVALLAITRDIHQRKLNEERLRRQHNELAHVCRLSTLGDLASGLAHELNQPLCAISSYAETATLLHDRDAATPDVRVSAILHKIVHQTGRASDIIQRLRELVRKRTPQPEAHDPGALLAEVLEIVESERRRCRVDIALSIAPEISPLWVDRVQTEQILLNLINNAIQAIDQNPGQRRTLEISVAGKDGQITISLRDYAGGVPEENRALLFTPFFTTKAEGIGMGLALSRSIAESLGGGLSYEPAENGSLFELTLPSAAEEP